MNRLDLEGKPFIQAIVRDVTKRRHAEAVLLETKTLMAAIVESTKDSIWSVDPVNFGLMTFNGGLAKCS